MSGHEITNDERQEKAIHFL